MRSNFLTAFIGQAQSNPFNSVKIQLKNTILIFSYIFKSIKKKA
jgi:hypothetical protein